MIKSKENFNFIPPFFIKINKPTKIPPDLLPYFFIPAAQKILHHKNIINILCIPYYIISQYKSPSTSLN